MSGSGPTYFVLSDLDIDLGEEYQVIRGLNFIPTGTEVM